MRLVLVGATREMRHTFIKQMIAGQSDLEIVMELLTTAWLAVAVSHERPDVVLVLDQVAPGPDAFDDVLEAHAPVRVIALAPDRRSAVEYRLEPRSDDLYFLSDEALLAHVRTAASAGRNAPLASFENSPRGGGRA